MPNVSFDALSSPLAKGLSSGLSTLRGPCICAISVILAHKYLLFPLPIMDCKRKQAVQTWSPSPESLYL